VFLVQVAAASALLDRLGALDHCKEIVQDMKAQVRLCGSAL
jgi:hypothetical protein